MEYVLQHIEAVVALKDILRVFGRLIGALHGLRCLGDKLNRLVRLQEHTHQRRLDCPDGVAHLCRHNARAAIFVFDLGPAVEIKLRLNSVMRNFSLNKVHSFPDRVIHGALDFIFCHALGLHVISSLRKKARCRS